MSDPTARRPAGYAALGAAVAGFVLSVVPVWMSVPLLALSLRAQGVGEAGIGLMAALPWVGLMLGASLVPGVIARCGLVGTLALGTATGSAALALYASSAALVAWAALQLVQGAALGLRWVAADTLVNGGVPDRLRGRLVGAYEMLAGGSIALGPALLLLTGVSGSLPFLAGAALQAAALVPLALARGVGRPSGAAADGPAPRGAALLRLDRAAYLGILLIGLDEAVTLALLPVWGVERGFDPADATTLIVVAQGGVLAGAPVLGGLADRVDRRRLLRVSIGGAALLPLALPATLGTSAGMPVLFAWGVAQGGVFTLAMIQLGQRFTGPTLARAVALATVVYTLGSLCGPLLAGALMAVAGPASLAAVLAAAGVAVLLAALP